MKLMHVVSKPMIEYVLSNHHMVFYPYYEDHEYVTAYEQRASRGEVLMQGLLPGCPGGTPSELILPAVGLGVSTICIPYISPLSDSALPKFFASPEVDQAVNRGVRFALVLVATKYESLAEIYATISEDYSAVVDTICLPIAPLCHEQYLRDDIYSGWMRFKTISRLVEDNLWDHDMEHHLYGLFNTAELVAYRRTFTDFVFSTLHSASSSLCFLSSLWGMNLSRDKGLFYKPIDECFSHGQFGKYLNMEMDAEQRRLFMLNEEIMQEHAEGMGGDALYERYLEKAEREGVRM